MPESTRYLLAQLAIRAYYERHKGRMPESLEPEARDLLDLIDGKIGHAQCKDSVVTVAQGFLQLLEDIDA